MKAKFLKKSIGPYPKGTEVTCEPGGGTSEPGTEPSPRILSVDPQRFAAWQSAGLLEKPSEPEKPEKPRRKKKGEPS